jgi:hypothetical protein
LVRRRQASKARDGRPRRCVNERNLSSGSDCWRAIRPAAKHFSVEFVLIFFPTEATAEQMHNELLGTSLATMVNAPAHLARASRYQFTLWRLMALIAGVAFLIPIGTSVRDMWYRRVSLLDRAANIAVNEGRARKFISVPNIAPESYEYWSAYVAQCARLRRHCERAATRPWNNPGPDPQ